MKSYNHLYEKEISDEVRAKAVHKVIRGQDKTLYQFSKVQAACVRLR